MRVVAAFDSPQPSGEDPAQPVAAWVASRLQRAQRDLLAGFPPTVTLDVDGLGPTLFCHGSPPARVAEFFERMAREGG